MSRPTTKNELKEQSRKNYTKLLDFIDSLSDEVLHAEFPEGYLNRNVRDVLAHLHHWHMMMLEWYKEGMLGNKPDMPAEGYTWKMLPDLNREIQGKYREMELEEVRTLLESSFEALQKVMDQHSEEELFEKKKYPWTGSTSLGAYLISATSSHYDWAYKLIKKCSVIPV